MKELVKHMGKSVVLDWKEVERVPNHSISERILVLLERFFS